MDDKEYYEIIKKINKNILYNKISKNKSEKWKDSKKLNSIILKKNENESKNDK